MARNGGFITFDAHGINLFCVSERPLWQPTLHTNLFICSSVVCEAVSQITSKGKGLLAEIP